jgi:hypothetical protein
MLARCLMARWRGMDHPALRGRCVVADPGSGDAAGAGLPVKALRL